MFRSALTYLFVSVHLRLDVFDLSDKVAEVESRLLRDRDKWIVEQTVDI